MKPKKQKMKHQAYKKKSFSPKHKILLPLLFLSFFASAGSFYILRSSAAANAQSFTVATYNILHSVNHADKSRALGGCNRNPVPNDPRCAKTRAERQINIIKGQAGNPAFDIVGTQETSPEQYHLLKSGLKNYGVFPENTSRLSNSKDGATAIYWNKSKFTKFASGKYDAISNTTKRITAPWVGLRTSSGHKVYVTSLHYATSTFGGTPQSIRRSAELTIDWVKQKAGPDATVIVLGDFNDRLPQEHYCIYTRNALMQHAADMAADARPGAGCKARRFNGIDHVYATPGSGLKASGFRHMKDEGMAARSSDHTPVYVTYKLNKPGDNAEIPPPPPASDQISKIRCIQLGRVFNEDKQVCKRVCDKAAGELIAVDGQGYYCKRAVASGISEARCQKINRIWLEFGCARRPDQKDVNNSHLQCLPGYPYYNSNSEASNSGRLDVCEKNRAIANENEANGIIGGVVVNPSDPEPGSNDSPTNDNGEPVIPPAEEMGGCNDGATLNPTTGACSNDETISQPSGSVVLAVDTNMSQHTCKLLGRKWVPASKDAQGTPLQAGCSTERCRVAGVSLFRNEGYPFCMGYAVKLDMTACNELHRAWIKEARACAVYPDQDRRKKTIVNAAQCAKPHTTYIILSSNEREDKCLKPGAVQRLRAIAQSSGKPFIYVASLPSRGLCKLRAGMMWEDGKCVPKAQPKQARILVVGDSMTARNKNERKFGKGWWGHLRDTTGSRIILSAQGGSGFIREGLKCGGTSFEDRLPDIRKSSPHYIIIAGGYNDGAYCKDGHFVHASEARIRSDITDYMTKLARVADEVGVPRENIYLFAPWGPGAEEKRSRVVPAIRDNAKRIGATYVDVAPLDRSQSYDGIHPTPAGSKHFYTQFTKNSNILSRLK